MTAKAFKTPQITRFVKANITSDQIEKNIEQLESVEKALEAYMENKRDAFPRFYFLSDDEVLEILAKSDNTDVIQQYLKQMFDGIVRINIADGIDITAMKSKEGEEVPMTSKVKISKEVDGWLDNLQKMMETTLRKEMKKSNVDYATQDRKDWVMKHFGQCVATIAQVQWCYNSELNINDMAEDNPFALGEWFDQ